MDYKTSSVLEEMATKGVKFHGRFPPKKQAAA